jgi:hypothetical protein
LNKKSTALSIAFLLTLAAFMFPLGTLAQGTMGVTIIQVTPSEQTGAAGTTGNLQGTIYTSNGSYQVIVGKTIVATGSAEGYYVDANFTVPELPSSTYALILRDVTINVNASDQFTVQIGYSISASPNTLPEGSSATITAAVTGGQLGTNYIASIVVTNPGGTTYSTSLTLGIPNVQGSARASVTFPSSSFTNGVTDFSGEYKLTFNQTLATGQFTVNILDSTTYHRGQTMNILATGYQANQGATITIVSSSKTIDTKSVTADENGIISTTWIVPSNTPIGDCTLKISTTSGTAKSPQDQQTFSIVGYNVKVQVTNLSNRAVPDIKVAAVDSETSTSISATSDSSGIAYFKLEKGSYGLTAYLNDVNIGSTNVTITGDGTFTLRCQLTDMKVTVKSADGMAMPFVNLNIKYQYQSGSISRSGNASGQTGPSGSFTLSSTVAGATYTITASIYNQVFNANNDTVNNLPNQASAEVVIICPSENVTLSVTGYSNLAIPNARVEFVELSNGLFYSATADSSGTVSTHVTFGNYRVRIYKDTTLVNESSLQVFNSTQKQIRCTLYGIKLQVSVVDLFGSPIPNANVTLNGSSNYQNSTENNGIAIFDNIIGGEMQIIAVAQGAPDASQAIKVNVDQPQTVQIKMDNYVFFGGSLIQASMLTTTVIILVAIVIFVVVEVFFRRKFNF